MVEVDPLIDDIDARTLETAAGDVAILERRGDDPRARPDDTVVFLRGDEPDPGWRVLMHDLPSDLRLLAVDAEDADALGAALTALGVPAAHFVARGSRVACLLEHARGNAVRTLTLAGEIAAADAAQLATFDTRPAVLWIHGEVTETAPFAAYIAAGGAITEVALAGVDENEQHSRPAVFRQSLLERMGYLSAPMTPAPPTEAVILKSAD